MIVRGGKHLTDEEIRFQPLREGVQEGRGSAATTEFGAQHHQVPGRHRHQRTAAAFPVLDGRSADPKALGKLLLCLANGFADDLERVAGDPPFGTPTSSQCCRRLPGHLPPLFVTGQSPHPDWPSVHNARHRAYVLFRHCSR
jgi:hypothetical protein